MREDYDARNPGAAQRRYYGRRQWTQDEDSLLGTDHDHVVAEVLERTTSSVGNRRIKLGIRKHIPTRRRSQNKDGYVTLYVHPGDPLSDMCRSNRSVFEHRYVMAQQLGRPLTRDEFVHHKNGIRNDNRPENLELWTRSHPDGQRVQDVLQWAREFIERYELDPVFSQ